MSLQKGIFLFLSPPLLLILRLLLLLIPCSGQRQRDPFPAKVIVLVFDERPKRVGEGEEEAYIMYLDVRPFATSPCILLQPHYLRHTSTATSIVQSEYSEGRSEREKGKERGDTKGCSFSRLTRI